MLPTPSPKCIVPPATTKMIRKVSNFDQTTTQNEETFRKGDCSLGGSGSQSGTEDAKKVLTDLASLE